MKSIVMYTLMLLLVYVSTATTQEIMERKQGECYSNVCRRKETEKLTKQNEELQTKIQELTEIIRNKDKAINDLKRKNDSNTCDSSTSVTMTTQCQDCGFEWEPFLRSCYYVGTNALTWKNATNACNSKCSTLAVITSAEENKFVISLAKRKGASDSEGYWLDGSDSLVEGRWIWSTIGCPFSYHNWGENEPNNRDSPEDCLELKTTKNYTWNDEKCITSKRQYICERTL